MVHISKNHSQVRFSSNMYQTRDSMWPQDLLAAMVIIDEGILWPRLLIEQIAAMVTLQAPYQIAAVAVSVCGCVRGCAWIFVHVKYKCVWLFKSEWKDCISAVICSESSNTSHACVCVYHTHTHTGDFFVFKQNSLDFNKAFSCEKCVTITQWAAPFATRDHAICSCHNSRCWWMSV